MTFTRGTALMALVWASLHSAPCHAQPLLDLELPLGRPARDVRVQLVSKNETSVELRVGRRTLALPWSGPTSPHAEAIALGPNAAVLRLVARADEGEVQALVGGPRATQLLFEGPTGLRGDPGEREGLALELTPKDDVMQVQLTRRAEALSFCRGTPLPLDVQQLQPDRLTLQDVEPELPAPSTEVTATPIEAMAPAPALHLVRPSAASDPTGAHVLSPPPRLDDGERASAVTAARGAAWLFLRATVDTAGFPIRAVELTAPDSGALPPQLDLELGGTTLRVTLDPKAPTQQVALPEPLVIDCLSVAARGPFTSRTTGVGELRVVTDLPAENPAAALAEAVASEQPNAAAAARLLTRLGAEGARASLAVWPRLSTQGRRRLLPALSPFLGEPEALTAVEDAARDEALSEPAVAILARSEGPGREALSRLAQADTVAGELALEALGETPGSGAWLLALLATEAGPSRPALRKALGKQARVDPTSLEGAVDTWLESAPLPARAALAQAIAGQAPRLTPLAERACQAAAMVPDADFVERYRCALAYAALPASPEGDSWLSQQAHEGDEWMQRAQALRALETRRSPNTRAIALEALADPVPRVRAAAALASRDAGLTPELSKAAEGDPWPQVRVAAVEALADDAEAAALLRGRVDDPSRSVRSVALAALTERRDASAWPLVRGRLEREQEFAAVRAAAVHYASTLCVTEAEPPLRAQLARGLGPEADEGDVAVAVDALRALRHLGGEIRERAERWLVEQAPPAGLSRAAGDPPSCPSASAPAAPNG